MRRYLGSPDDLLLAEARASLAGEPTAAPPARRAGPRLVPSIVRPTRRADARVVTPIIDAPDLGQAPASESRGRIAPSIVEASASGPRRPMLGARLVPSVIRARKRSLR